ncbi:MAG TPA: hypothetical protein OIM50_00345 [Clostridiaceae bacterium]|nr:hypothetical protein [Clostridiaceae bacterium]
MEDIRNQDRRNNMANCNCKGVQIEVICTKKESQKKECYICVMTPDQPSGDYLKAKTSEGLYFIGIPRTVKHVYRAVSVPAEVESLHLFFEGVERNLPILFK